MGFEQPEYTINENSMTFEVCLLLNATIGTRINVTVSLLSGSAQRE